MWFHLSYYYPIPPEGEWDLVVVWFHLRYYYYYPIPPEGEWDLVVVWFHLSYYYYYRRSSSSKGFSVLRLVRFPSSLEAISMKLGGHIGHGPNSSYHHFWHHMTCCHGIMTENVITKWTNECTNCEVPGRDGQNSFIPWYLVPCPKHFLYLKFFADLWPDLDIGQR